MSFHDPQNPGIGGLDELTSTEESIIQRIAALNPVAGAILYYGTSQWQSLAIGSAGQILQVSSGLPAWGSSGAGDFSGPASSTDNAIVRFDGTGGKTGQNSVVIIGDTGNITGALNISAGSLMVSDAATTRTNLGLAIGTNVQAYDATLNSIASLGTIANRTIYTTGIDTWAETALTAFGRNLIASNLFVNAADYMIYTSAADTWTTTVLTSFGRSLIDDASAATARTTLGLAIGTNVQAWDAQLDDIAALAVTDSNFIVGNGTNWVAESGAIARTSMGLGTSDTPQFARLGLGIAADGSAVLNLAAITSQILAGGGNPRRSIILTGAGGWGATTFGASGNTKNAVGSGGTTTEGAVNYYALGFDTSTLEFAQWSVVMPDNYDGGALTAKFYWTSATTSGNVIFALQGRSYGDDEAFAGTWSSAVTVTDTMGNAADDVMISAETASLTLAGTPAAGELVQFRVYRDGANGADTLGAEASLLMVRVEYGISQYSD